MDKETNYQQLHSSGVTTIVASFGTVDLLNMHRNKQTPAQVAQSVGASARDFRIGLLIDFRFTANRF